MGDRTRAIQMTLNINPQGQVGFIFHRQCPGDEEIFAPLTIRVCECVSHCLYHWHVFAIDEQENANDGVEKRLQSRDRGRGTDENSPSLITINYDANVNKQGWLLYLSQEVLLQGFDIRACIHIQDVNKVHEGKYCRTENTYIGCHGISRVTFKTLPPRSSKSNFKQLLRRRLPLFDKCLHYQVTYVLFVQKIKE